MTSRVRTSARVTLTVVLWAAAGALAATLLATTASNFFGYRSLTVLSGSMEPRIHTGDLVIARRITAEQARIGDIVTFREPGSTRLITHRVRKIRMEAGIAGFTTKGDANNTAEHWNIPADGQISRAAYRLPRAGYVKAGLSSRYGSLGLITIPALGLLFLELGLIRRSGPRVRPC